MSLFDAPVKPGGLDIGKKPVSRPAEKPKPFDFGKLPMEPKTSDPDPQDRR